MSEIFGVGEAIVLALQNASGFKAIAVSFINEALTRAQSKFTLIVVDHPL